MAIVPVDIRNALKELSRDELNIVARKLRVKGFRKLRQPELIEELCRLESTRLRTALELSWWDRYRNSVFGWASIIGCILGIVGILLYFIPADDAALVRSLNDVEQKRTALQSQLDLERQRSSTLVRGVEHTIGRSESVAREDQRLLDIATELRRLLQEFDLGYAQVVLTPEEDLQLRLARATLALADARFDDVLTIVTADDVRLEHGKTDLQISREFEVNRVRSEALIGENRWNDALTGFDRCIELRGDHIPSLMGRASCLYYLDRFSEARGAWDRIVERLSESYHHGATSEIATAVATSYANRGGTSAEMGDLEKAHTDLVVARDMFDALLAKDPTGSNLVDLALTKTRLGDVMADQGEYEHAIAEFDGALLVYRKILSTSGKNRFRIRSWLAHSLHNRATVLVEQDRIDEAIDSLNEAIETQSELVAKSVPGQSASLAASLVSRSIALTATNDVHAADFDANRAVTILDRLIEEEGIEELRDSLAHALLHRARSRFNIGELAGASGDAERAFTVIVAMLHEGRDDVVDDCAVVLMETGRMLVHEHDRNRSRETIEDAFAALEKAVEIYRGLVANHARNELRPQLAMALTIRASANARLQHPEAAAADTEEAVEILTELVEAEGRTELKAELALSLTNHACALTDRGDIAQSLAAFDQAIELYRAEPLAQAAGIQLPFAQTLMLRARTLGNHGRAPEAVTDLDNAIAILQPLVDSGRNDLFSTLARAVRHRAAAAAAQPLTDK